jgi:DNA-binding IclR family transcriptional regulator
MGRVDKDVGIVAVAVAVADADAEVAAAVEVDTWVEADKAEGKDVEIG